MCDKLYFSHNKFLVIGLLWKNHLHPPSPATYYRQVPGAGLGVVPAGI